MQETEEIKIELMKKKICELLSSNDGKNADKYIRVLHNIIEWEKTHPKTELKGQFGWQMGEIEGLNGGLLNQLVKAGIVGQGYYSNKYHCYLLEEHYSIVEMALDDIEMDRQEQAIVKARESESPVITEEDIAEFKEILSKYDALDYWSKYVAPSVCGYDRVKKLILVQIASPDDTKNSRGRIHLLLEGEPGTGKSMFREWVTYEIGAEYASMRTTGAGLTRDMRTGEPGALDRAHASVWRMVTLEELRDWDRDQLEMLKESLSEGKYPLQGAGVNEIVDAMVRVLACTNEIDSKKFSPQFLDRFDVIIHFDRPTKEQANPIIDKMVDDFMVDVETEKDVMRLKKYLWWTKQYYPEFSQDARKQMKLLIKIYKDSKYKDGEKVNLRTTVGGILRIAYTIARLNHRPVNPLYDCIKAIELADTKFDEVKLEGIPAMYKKIIDKMKND